MRWNWKESPIDLTASEYRVNSAVKPPTMPCQLPTMCLVLGFTASPIEVGTEKRLEIVLIDPDGNRLLQLNNNVIVPLPKRPGNSSSLASIIALNGVQFQTFGNFHFSILVNGEEKTTVPVRVNNPMSGIPEGEL